LGKAVKKMIRVLIFNEFAHEQKHENVKAIYPCGMHATIRDFLSEEDDISVETVTLFNENLEINDLESIITEEKLQNTDVIMWWGHGHHGKVPDVVAARVQQAVLGGMGAVFLHSGHHSKPFKLLMGTTCNVDWREDGDLCRVWVTDPSHPITQGIDRFIKLDNEEMYCEPFGIPEPDKLLFINWYEGGEAFRSGAIWRRGYGKIFYFQPGHETYPVYHNKDVQTVIKNGVRWAAPDGYRASELKCHHVKKIGEQ